MIPPDQLVTDQLVKRIAERAMPGDINMGDHHISNLKDPPAGGRQYAATKEYVDKTIGRVIASTIQSGRLNINLLSSQGTLGDFAGTTVCRFFSSGLILPKGCKIIKISLSTSPTSSTSTKHILKMFHSSLTEGNHSSNVVLEKTAGKLQKSISLTPPVLLEDESFIHFDLECKTGTGATSAFNGQSTLVVHVELAII